MTLQVSVRSPAGGPWMDDVVTKLKKDAEQRKIKLQCNLTNTSRTN